MPRDSGLQNEITLGFLRRMPREIARSFTAKQLEALNRAFAPGPHHVDLRVSIPLWRRFYLVLLLGPEQRSAERRRQDRFQRPLWTVPNVGVMVSLAAVTGLAVLSAVGIATGAISL